ncbi:MAG TPA: adenosylcobinamide-GDP ribazoletransferase [Steroidobacteraceae bacterium]|nr:adenosylcobinamide-GDP ribazoletransferase [Steroidobacteraceae bacterium]
MSHQLRLLLVAAQFLTRLPTPEMKHYQPDWLAQSARYFPLVGVLVGLINVAVWWLAARWLPPAVAIGLMMAVSMLVTGALHEDGFADACDGLGAGASRERALAIMKDSRIGAYGAIGLFLVLGLKWAALDALPGASFALIVIASHMFSRWCAIGPIAFLPYVRAEADGKARPFADRLSVPGWIASGIVGLAAVGAFAWAGARHGALDVSLLGVAACAAALCALLAAGYLRHRIGGYTGDCLGAVQQLAELGFLLGALAAAHSARQLG